MAWTPTLPDSDQPIYERLVTAMAADIGEGVLAPGERLPPQRELAWRLGLGVGTVSKAYAEAERRGLLSGQVGRGSFVAAQAAGESQAPLDMARNLPPPRPARTRLAGAMAQMARDPALADRLAYPPS